MSLWRKVFVTKCPVTNCPRHEMSPLRNVAVTKCASRNVGKPNTSQLLYQCQILNTNKCDFLTQIWINPRQFKNTHFRNMNQFQWNWGLPNHYVWGLTRHKNWPNSTVSSNSKTETTHFPCAMTSCASWWAGKGIVWPEAFAGRIMSRDYEGAANNFRIEDFHKDPEQSDNEKNWIPLCCLLVYSLMILSNTSPFMNSRK